MLSKRLREIRKKFGLTQYEFAKAVKSTQGKIGKLETDRQDIDSKIMIEISKQFGVNIHWLVTGEGNMILDDDYVSEREKEYKIEIRVLRELAGLARTKKSRD